MSLHKLTKYESELTSNPMIVPGNKLKFKYIFINLWNAALEGMNTTVDRQVVCGIHSIVPTNQHGQHIFVLGLPED